MWFKSIFAVGFGLFGLLPPATAGPAPPIGSNNTTPASKCDSLCAQHLLYRTAYSSAATGFGMVLRTCNATAWCMNEAIDFCPNVINATLTKVADVAKTEMLPGLDYNNMNNLTLLSSMSMVSARSTRMTLSLAQAMLKSGDKACSAESATQLEKVRWVMDQQEVPIWYDAEKFEQELANMNDTLPGTGLVKHGDDGGDNDDSGLDALYALLAVPVLGFGGAAGTCSKFDWILCDARRSLSRLFRHGKEILPKSNVVQSVIDDSLQVLSQAQIDGTASVQSQIRSVWQNHATDTTKWAEKAPPQFDGVREDSLTPPGSLEDGTPSRPPSDPHPAKISKLYRAQVYNPVEGTMTQLAVIPANFQPDKYGQAVWEVVGARGRGGEEFIYGDPSTTISRMPGKWIPKSSPDTTNKYFIRMTADANGEMIVPVLDGLGAPLVSTSKGELAPKELMSLAPIKPDAAGNLPFGVFPGLDRVVFRMLTSWGMETDMHVHFTPKSNFIDIRDAPKDPNQRNTPTPRPPYEGRGRRPSRPPTTSLEATETHHSHPTSTPEHTSMPNTDHPTGTTKPGSTPTPDPSSVPSNEQTTAQSPPAPSSMPVTLSASAASSKLESSSSLAFSSRPATMSTGSSRFATSKHLTVISSPQQSTLSATTTSKSLSTSNASPTPIQISGCTSFKDCRCSPDTPCKIVDRLPPECNVAAPDIYTLPSTSNITWNECYDPINSLLPKQAKAWVSSITPRHCLPENEWEPSKNVKENGGECYAITLGDEFAKVRDTYIQGMLPSECPSAEDGDISEGEWWNFWKLEKPCRRVADILLQPFENGDEAGSDEADSDEAGSDDEIQYYGEVACQFYPCLEDIAAEEKRRKETCWCDLEFFAHKRCLDGSSHILWPWWKCYDYPSGPPS